MIKRFNILFFVLLLLLVPNVLRAQYPVFGDERRPKGNIKSFIESCYETSQGTPVLVSKSKFVYDTKGVLIERIIYDTIDSAKVFQTVKFVYEDGLIYEEVGETYKIRHAYDNNGKKLAEKYSSINVNYLKRYDYNTDGLVVKLTNYNAKGKLLYTESFKYDDQKALFTFFHTVPDSTSQSYQAIYTTDVKGRRLGERVYATTGYIKHSGRFDYDAQGQLITETRYNYTGSFMFKNTFKYDYDIAGNWTYLVNKNKNSSYITKREIEYN